MKAAILQTPGQLDLVDLVIDKPAAHEVLIRVVGSGLCHSDLHAIDAQVPNRPIIVPGHEASGIVEQVGSEVTYVQPGDHVITFLVQFCGECEYCLGGRPTICATPVGARKPDAAATAPNPRLTYQGKPVGQFANLGAFAEQMLVHEHAVAKIDRDYPMDRAAIIGCGVCTGLGSVLKSAAVRPGSTVAVVGGGGVGLSAVQGARLAGARRIILVDIQPEKFDLARKAGATDCVDPGQGDPVQQIKDLTGGGVDYSFECLGLKATCEQSVQMLRPGGVATIIGLGGRHLPAARRAARAGRLHGLQQLPRRHAQIHGSRPPGPPRHRLPDREPHRPRRYQRRLRGHAPTPDTGPPGDHVSAVTVPRRRRSERKNCKISAYY